MAEEVIWLAVLEVYDTVAGVDLTLYFSNDGITSTPTDSPPNTFFDPRIKTPIRVRRSMFAPDKTFGPSEVGFGDLVLVNEDGGLDFFADLAVDGRRASQHRGVRGAGGKFLKQLSVIMDQVILTRQLVTVKLKDRQTQVEKPFQTNKFLGTNVLPDGLEGVEDLDGKPKPILYGRVRNIAPPIVNTQKLIYQISDGGILSVEAVYDSGIDLSKSPRLWEQETTPITEEIKAIRFGQGSLFASTAKFVAVAFNGSIMTSEDGETWTSRTNPFGSSDNINYVGFSEEQGLWVAVGDGIGGSPNGGIATSTDGITWTIRSSPFAPGTQIFSVVFGLTLSGPVWVIGASAGQVATSTDGINWTLRVAAVSSFSVFSIIFGRRLFVKVLGSTSDTEKLQTSPDGITWTDREAGLGPFVFLTRGFFGKGAFIVAGRDLGATPNDDKTIYSISQDGISWTPQDLTLGTITRDVSYSEALGKWLLTGENEISGVTSQILSSLDGLPPWEVNDPLFGTDTPKGIGVGPLITVVGGDAGKVGRIVAAAENPYTTEAELLDDSLAPVAGTYRAFLGGGYFRLGTPPFGQITVDATEGATVSDRTAATLYKNVILKSGLRESDIRGTDLTKLDSAIPDELGFWSGTNEILSSLIINQIAESAGAWWGIDALGTFRIEQVLNPDLVPIFRSFVSEDMQDHLNRSLIQDVGRGIPPFRTIVRYRKNHTIQDTGLALGVSDARRGELSKPFDDVTANNSNVQIDHLLSSELVFTSLIFNQADAKRAVQRFQALRGAKRDPYEFSVQCEGNMGLDLGIGVEITHDRFGLDEGKRTIIIGIDPDPLNDKIKLTVWG